MNMSVEVNRHVSLAQTNLLMVKSENQVLGRNQKIFLNFIFNAAVLTEQS